MRKKKKKQEKKKKAQQAQRARFVPLVFFLTSLLLLKSERCRDMTKTFAPSPTTSKRSHRLKSSRKLSSTSHSPRVQRGSGPKERADDGGARSQCCSMRVSPPLNPSHAQPLSPSRSAFGARFSPRLSSPTCSLSDAAGEREMYLP